MLFVLVTILLFIMNAFMYRPNNNNETINMSMTTIIGAIRWGFLGGA